MKDWYSLSKQEKIEAFLNLNRADIGESPGQWGEDEFLSKLTESGLLNDAEVREHLASHGLLPRPKIRRESSQ